LKITVMSLSLRDEQGCSNWLFAALQGGNQRNSIHMPAMVNDIFACHAAGLYGTKSRKSPGSAYPSLAREALFERIVIL